MDWIIGIDPGFSGAVATYAPSTGTLYIEDMPVTKDPKGRTVLDMVALYELLTPPPGARVQAFLEYVAARPGQGAPATFRFGQGYGALQMALAANRISTQYVTPAKWKRHFGLGKEKESSRNLAIQRFASEAKHFARAKDDGRAEAALIALYGHEAMK